MPFASSNKTIWLCKLILAVIELWMIYPFLLYLLGVGYTIDKKYYGKSHFVGKFFWLSVSTRLNAFAYYSANLKSVQLFRRFRHCKVYVKNGRIIFIIKVDFTTITQLFVLHKSFHTNAIYFPSLQSFP